MDVVDSKYTLLCCRDYHQYNESTIPERFQNDEITNRPDKLELGEVDDVKEKQRSDESEDDLVDSDESEEEQDEFAGLDLIPINIPEVDANKHLIEYTVVDVGDNNDMKGKNNWFLHERNVYSLEDFTAIVRDRIQQYLELTEQDDKTVDDVMSSYHPPTEGAKAHGVKEDELMAVLPACQIGKLIKMSRAEYLARMKNYVDGIKTDLESKKHLTETLTDYLAQLYRWLYNYPNNELETSTERLYTDPNKCEFPLPEQIRADSTLLRHWIKDWQSLEFSLDGDAAWNQIPFLNEDLGDTHETFIEVLSQRVDEEIPDMDLDIDGEAAWEVIDIDIIKNDITTKTQDSVIKARERRTDLKDKARMKRRREQLAKGFLSRHKYRLKQEDMVPYLDWATRLEQQWVDFQTLCI